MSEILVKDDIRDFSKIKVTILDLKFDKIKTTT